MKIFRLAAIAAVISALFTVFGTSIALADPNTCDFTDTGSALNLNGDCTTTETIHVPDGYTLNGKGHTITAVDPDGASFLGAVVANAGSSMNVTKLNVRADGLKIACHAGADRLAGIKLDGASGSITKSSIIGINQGASGCQEGNAIEVRNQPFDGSGVNPLAVEIAHNTIDAYQKSGIVVVGDVVVNINHNDVGVSVAQANLAANSIQVSYGASGSVTQNNVDGNQWLGPSDTLATAMLIYAAKTIEVSKNNIRGNSDVGIYLYLNGAVTADNNKVFDDGVDGGHYDIGIGAWDGTEVLTNNKVRGFDTAYDGLTDLGTNKIVGKPAN